MYLRIRQLLYCQDELAKLQKELLEQDNEDARTDDGRGLLLSRKRYTIRNDKFPQKSLSNKIISKLKEYGKRCRHLLWTFAHVAFRRPDGKDKKGCITESS